MLKKVLCLSKWLFSAMVMFVMFLPCSTKAADSNITVKIQGNMVTDEKQAILDYVNAIRREAYDEGLSIPGYPGLERYFPAHTLTSEDYVPLKWSSDMEEIARIRAVEAAVYFNHTRPNQSSSLALQSSNGYTASAENIASGNSDIYKAIDSWASEKEYLAQSLATINSDTATITQKQYAYSDIGHYMNMIMPEMKSFGLARFETKAKSGYNSLKTVMNLSGRSNVDETKDPSCGEGLYDLEIPLDTLSIALSEENGLISVAEGLPMSLSAQAWYKSAYPVFCGDFDWTSDNTAVATVNNSGSVSTVGEGTANISASIGSVSKAYSITVTPPEIVSMGTLDGVDTDAGIAPVLPENLQVTWTNGNTTDENITWDAIEPAQYNLTDDDPDEKSFAVNGTVKDKAVQTTITVRKVTISNPAYTLDPAEDSDFYMYSGNEIKPDIASLSNNERTLLKDQDYTIDSYDNNTEVGEGKITIRGVNNFKGSAVLTFTIRPCEHKEMTSKIIDPTCTEGGYTIHTCNRCGHTYNDSEVEALGHNWSEWDVETEATCTEEGKSVRSCKRCQATENKTIEAKGHDYKEEVFKPTCTEGGYTKHTCSRCSDTYNDTETDPLGHLFGAFTEKDEQSHVHTCTREGCGYSETLAHSWDNGTVTEEATCTTAGVRTFTCTDCAAEKTEVISALGHDYAASVVLPTCTQDGYTKHVCSRCEDTYNDTETDPLGHLFGDFEKKDDLVHIHMCTREGCEYSETLAHNWDNGTVTEEATCAAEGTMTYTCTDCNAKKTDAIPQTNVHTPVITKTGQEATCLENGCTDEITCSVCHITVQEQETITALGHDYEDTVVAPTCTEAGYTEHVCSRCNDTYTDQETAALGHDYEDTVVAPTCTEAGYTEHVCSRCKDSYTDHEIAASGHNYGSWTNDTADSHKRICVNDPTHVESSSHEWDDGKVTVSATSSSTGVKTYTCTVCGGTKEEEIPKLTPETIGDPATAPGKNDNPDDPTAAPGNNDTPEDPATAPGNNDTPDDPAAKDPEIAAAEEKPLSPEEAPGVKVAEKAIIKITGNGDPKGSKFSILQARAKKVTKNAVTLAWTKVDGASGYIIYGNQCGRKNKYVKVAEISTDKTVKKTIKKIGKNKIKKGTYYKFIVAAVAKDKAGAKKVIATSKSIHFITAGNKKYGDFTKVLLKNVRKNKLSLTAGKTFTVKAEQVKPRKLKVSQHRKLACESTNTAIAKVDNKGRISAKKAGKCTVFVYSQNGLFQKIEVTVK